MVGFGGPGLSRGPAIKISGYFGRTADFKDKAHLETKRTDSSSSYFNSEGSGA